LARQRHQSDWSRLLSLSKEGDLDREWSNRSSTVCDCARGAAARPRVTLAANRRRAFEDANQLQVAIASEAGAHNGAPLNHMNSRPPRRQRSARATAAAV